MATSKTLLTPMDGTPEQICFADHAGDFSPTAANNLQESTPTTCQLSLASVADTAARQSTKVDLGSLWAEDYEVFAAFEFAATPTAAEVVELYWAPSSSATAGTANPANVTGSDAAYSGYSSNLADSVRQLQWIGNFITTVQATGTVQVARVGVFSPTQRYGSLIVKNESGAAYHSDDVESHVVFNPIIPQGQAS